MYLIYKTTTTKMLIIIKWTKLWEIYKIMKIFQRKSNSKIINKESLDKGYHNKNQKLQWMIQ